MLAILNYVQAILLKIVEILNFKPFADFPVSFIELMCCGVFLKYVFRLIFGGFNETERQFNFINNASVSRAMSNFSRKRALNNSSGMATKDDIQSLRNDVSDLQELISVSIRY